MAYAIDPSLFDTEYIRVDVEVKSDLAAGQTICDKFNLDEKPKNAWVAKTMNVPGFWNLIYDAIDKAQTHVAWLSKNRSKKRRVVE